MTDDVTLKVSEMVSDLKRAAGFLVTCFADLQLHRWRDPRRAAGKRWRLDVALRAVLIGMFAGCKSLAEVERLTSNMSKGLRKKLGIPRRLPDTTLRTLLTRLDPDDVREALYAFVHAAVERKALLPEKEFPFHALAVDGKGTAILNWDDVYSQRHRFDGQLQAYGLVRTMNAALISSAVRPVIASSHIHATTNEVGAFGEFFASLLANYGKLFRVVTYDAGGVSEQNCTIVVKGGKDFFFRVKTETWHVLQEANRLLGPQSLNEAAAKTEDVIAKEKGKVVIRRVFFCKAPALSIIWHTVKTFVRVHVQHITHGKLTAEEDKFYISSMTPDTLTGDQWLALSRGHWGVENNVHWVLDAIFREDTRPWIVTEPKGTVVVMMLRRLALSMLGVFRKKLMRKDERRQVPWPLLLDWMYRAVVGVSEQTLSELRSRGNDLALS